MAGSNEDRGPDIAVGVDAASVPADGVFAGHVGEESVILARVEGRIVALTGACTHYSAPLAKGLRVGDTLRCPWHHACFSLRTGAALEAPALSPLDRWTVEEKDGRVFVREKAEAEPTALAETGDHPKSIVIVGGGAAGFAAAQRLRDLGYAGPMTLLSGDSAAPYDRPNVSKDYLAGEADPAWMPLKDDAFYADHKIDLRLGVTVERLDTAARTLTLNGGETLDYGALLLATGAEPNRPDTPGFDRPNVFVLRTLADSDAVIRAAGSAGTVAVVGASFIGLEAAAAFVKRGLTVHVVAPEALPLESKLGPELGKLIQTLHEKKGVTFHLSRKARGFNGKVLTMDDNTVLAVDFIVVGVGVKPRTALPQAAGLTVDKGVTVDARFRTSAEGVFAAGDIALYPDPVSDAPIRVEHWVAAERQGQIAAANMLGLDQPIAEPPFFWSAHYDLSIRYVGHAETWDRIEIDGSLENRDAEVRYIKNGETLATATVGRDMAALKAAQANAGKSPPLSTGPILEL